MANAAREEKFPLINAASAAQTKGGWGAGAPVVGRQTAAAPGRPGAEGCQHGRVGQEPGGLLHGGPWRLRGPIVFLLPPRPGGQRRDGTLPNPDCLCQQQPSHRTRSTTRRGSPTRWDREAGASWGSQGARCKQGLAGREEITEPGGRSLGLRVGRAPLGQSHRPPPAPHHRPIPGLPLQLWTASSLCHLSLLCTCLHLSSTLAKVLELPGTDTCCPLCARGRNFPEVGRGWRPTFGHSQGHQCWRPSQPWSFCP